MSKKSLPDHPSLWRNSPAINFYMENISAILSSDPNGPQTLSDYLESSDLASFFPRTAFRFSGIKRDNINKHSIDAYWLHASLLNNISVMSQLLRSDINEPNHKYMAHQLALLYQSLNQAGDALVVYKKDIELHFDVIKKATNDPVNPVLPTSEQEWLVDITGRILETTHRLTGELRTPFDTLLHHIGGCGNALTNKKR